MNLFENYVITFPLTTELWFYQKISKILKLVSAILSVGLEKLKYWTRRANVLGEWAKLYSRKTHPVQ